MVERFIYDAENESHISRHGITAVQLEQVLEGAFSIHRNRSDRSATHVVIGRDAGGGCIAVFIEPTDRRGVWRPVTAHYCTETEWRRIGRERE